VTVETTSRDFLYYISSKPPIYTVEMAVPVEKDVTSESGVVVKIEAGAGSADSSHTIRR
jgi:hypothetical protein